MIPSHQVGTRTLRVIENTKMEKLKHLDYIQETIKRMAGNSFLLRGWSITLVIAIFTLASREFDPIYYWIALFTTIVFWALDSYYLSQERKFRCLYNEVRKKDSKDIDFSMAPIKNHCDECTWRSAAQSPVFLVFYGITALALVVVLNMAYLDISITLK